MNRRWLIWIPLLSISTWLVVSSENPLAVVEAKPLERPTPSSATERMQVLATTKSGVLFLEPRGSLWNAQEANEPIIDLFATRDWDQAGAAPAPAVLPSTAVTTAAPEPPVLAAPPFVYLGRNLNGKAWEVFLGYGEQTLIVQEGAVIEPDYRVESIKPPVLTLRHLPTSKQQTLSIGEGD